MTRVAVVGAGSVARRHVGVLTGLPGVSVVAVADPAPGAAETLAGQCGARAFADAEEALDAVEVDAVYVCVPPFAHGAAEEAALARGLPLFVEKPLAADLATAEQLEKRVDAAGVVTGTGYHWRCLDVLGEVRRRLEERPPLLATAYWLDKRPPVPWWGWQMRSGGQVVEQATHVLDLARLLLGEAVEVYAAAARGAAARDGEVDDATAATVRFSSGAVATVAATSVLGAKHRAALHTVSPGQVLEISETGLVVLDEAGRREVAVRTDPRVTVDEEFVAAVRGEREGTRVPYSEALRTHRLACALAASAATGRTARP